MPYIKKDLRISLTPDSELIPTTAGELNFQLTSIVLDYVDGPVNYQKINDVLGALEGAKLEFYRRVAVPYEEQKIKENGDVY
jgi:hypothetical protein